MIKNGKIQILTNPASGGRGVASWLQSLGVSKLIVSHMGKNPFKMLQNDNIKVYFAGSKRIELTDVLVKYADGDLVTLNDSNYDKYFTQDHNKHNQTHGYGNGCGFGMNKNKIEHNLLVHKIQNQFTKFSNLFKG